MEQLIITLGAALAALAAPLPAVFSPIIHRRTDNPLRHCWEVAMLFFSAFGMTLLCGMVFLIVFAKLYALWPFLGIGIPVLIGCLAVLEYLSGNQHLLFPPRRERTKWYQLTAQEHHPVLLGSITAAGELFTSGAPLLLAAAYLAKLPSGATVFHEFSPLLYYALAFTAVTATLSFGKDRERTGSYRKWNVLLCIASVAAVLWMLFT